MKAATAAIIVAASIILLPQATVSAATYTVVQGDTLYKIARQHQTTVESLMAANRLTSDKLSIGQQLIVNAGNQTQPAAGEKLAQAPSAAPSSPPPAGDTAGPAAAEMVPVVNADILNVRATPSLSGEILGKLPYGTVLDVVETGQEWTKIRFNSREAYVATQYVSYRPKPSAVSSTGKSQPDAPDNLEAALHELIQPLLNTPYVYGGTTPEGFDCSGFTSYVFQQLGVTLARTSEGQFQQGEAVPFEQAQPGDLLFYDTLNKGTVSHVGIYLGNGLMVHANGDKVDIEKVEYMHKLYPFYGAKRFF